MYIPKVKCKVGGKIDGFLIDPKTGRRFLGDFVQDYKGNFYKGTTVNSTSEVLKFEKKVTENKNKVEGLRFIYRKPAEKDYKAGFFTRYFIRDETSNKVVEVNRAKYIEIRKSNTRIYSTVKLDWLITGESDDTYIDGYKVSGLATLNSEIIQEKSKELKGLDTQVLKDPLEFVRK
jgi:hypothetical protein